VYSSTAYSDVAAMQPADYPELFMFYSLDGNRKVICKSIYIGLDLHSYPPRAGNYISHALLYTGNELFNPVEIYENAKWKTARDIENEDREVVPEHIDSLQVVVNPDFYENKWFKNLLIKLDNSNNVNDSAIRQRMFKIAVNSIINREQVIISDKKEMLLYWAMALLQAFPLDFVFNHLTIASFANSNLLLDVCRVLCIEKENAERIMRHVSKARIIDFDNPGSYIPSTYADVLTKVIIENDFDGFRKKVFPKIAASRNYSLREFNNHSLFYEKLYEVENMSSEEFEKFFALFVNQKDCIDDIFNEVSRKQHADKCSIMWKELRKTKTILASDLAHYDFISKYTIPPLTDDKWLDFENDVAGRLSFTSVDEINRFFDITKIDHPQRETLYYDSVMTVIKKTWQHETIEEGLIAIRQRIVDLTDIQKQDLDKIKRYHYVLNNVKKTDDPEKKYKFFLDDFQKLDDWQVTILTSLLPQIGWKEFFILLDKDIFLLRYLYQIPPISYKLVQKDLALSILEKTYLHDSEELYKFYSALGTDEKKLFEEYTTQEIREIIISKLPIDNLTGLEEILKNFSSTISINTLLNKLIRVAEKNSSFTELWKLCSIVHTTDNRSFYPTITASIREEHLSIIYRALDNINIPIPAIHERLARILHDRRFIKRPVPRDEMLNTTYELRSIGKLSHLENVKNILTRRSFDHNVLLELIKLPWPHYAWEILFEQLDKENREKLPAVLGNLLSEINNNSNKYSVSKWNNIICHYYVFLIVENKKDHFYNLTGKISISWDDYNYIKRAASVLMNGQTEVFDIFLKADNNTRWGYRGKAPDWRKDND
jgi:hypothetical protein